MEIKPIGEIAFNTIYKAFDQAFEDYEVRVNKLQLQKMLKRRGFNPDVSFAAFDNNEMVAFTLNGMGDFNGISTAYDTGTGTLKEYRGKGLATKIFEYSIPYLKKVNIKQYLLEVLQHNTNAISVYKNLDFKVTREFNYFFQKNKEIKDNVKKQEMRCFIKRMDTLDFNGIREFWDFHPSWQNSFEAVKRDIEAFVFFGAYIDKKLVGYCVFEPASGDITQIAVDKHYRKQGIGTGLFFEATRLNKNDTVKIVNTDISCHSITNFLETKQIPLTGKQFEMIKRL